MLQVGIFSAYFPYALAATNPKQAVKISSRIKVLLGSIG